MNIAVIGYGSIGQRHTAVLETLWPDAVITVVTRQTLARPHVDRIQALDLARLDYAVIATPTAEHFANLKALREGMMAPILVEKPVFDRSYPTDFSVGSTFVGYNLRFHPLILWLKSWVSGQRIFSVQVVAGQYLPQWRPKRPYQDSYSAQAGQGGVLLDLSHELDYLSWIFGPMIVGGATLAHCSDLEIETEDVAFLSGTFEQGGAFQLGVDYLSLDPLRHIMVHGSVGTCRVDFVANTFVVTPREGEGSQVTEHIDRNAMYAAMHRDILENQGRQTCTFQEGLAVVQTIEIARRLSGWPS